MTGYCFVRDCPHRGVSCRSLFVVGSMKGLILAGSEILRIFEVPLGRKSLPSFTNYDLNKEDGQKDAFRSS